MAQDQHQHPEQNDPDLYLLADEDGNEAAYRLVFREILNENEYGVIIPADEDSDEGISIVSLHWSEEDQAEDLETIDDEEIIDVVYADFLEAFPELDEDKPDEEERVFVMEDDEGVSVTFRQINRTVVDGITYALLALDEDEDSSAMVFIVNTDENGVESLAAADEETADDIFYLFLSENEDYEYGPAE